MKLSQSRYSEIAGVFGAYRFSVLQAFDQIINLLKERNFTIQEMCDYVSDNREAFDIAATMREDLERGKILFRECPECGAMMNIEPVNSNKRDQVGGKWKSVFTCIRKHQDCGHQIFSKKTIHEERFDNLKKGSRYKDFERRSRHV